MRLDMVRIAHTQASYAPYITDTYIQGRSPISSLFVKAYAILTSTYKSQSAASNSMSGSCFTSLACSSPQ